MGESGTCNLYGPARAGIVAALAVDAALAAAAAVAAEPDPEEHCQQRRGENEAPSDRESRAPKQAQRAQREQRSRQIGARIGFMGLSITCG